MQPKIAKSAASDLAHLTPDDILRAFQSGSQQAIEETFAQIFSERDDMRLYFINEDEAYTDGRSIVVDPALHRLYIDQDALEHTISCLHWPRAIIADTWSVLCLITRSQTIHECLHLLYTSFPPDASQNPHYHTRNERRIAAYIGNVIEDAYIEAVGASCYDNIAGYLRFGRLASWFGTLWEPKLLIDDTDTDDDDDDDSPAPPIAPPLPSREVRLLLHLLHLGTHLLLCPVDDTDDLQSWTGEAAMNLAATAYDARMRPLWLAGSMAASPAERASYARRLFDIIQPLIPPDDEPLNLAPIELHLYGTRTHAADSDSHGSCHQVGRSQVVSVRLFPDDYATQPARPDLSIILHDLEGFARLRDNALAAIAYRGHHHLLHGDDYRNAARHRGITIHENHPAIKYSLRPAYENIRRRYQVQIRTQSARLTQLVQRCVAVREEHFRFGSGISSRHLGDPQRRYWYRLHDGDDTPELTVLLLVDGSGSMDWDGRYKAATASAVILHEVLARQGIAHAIVEHRADFYKPEIDINVLRDFHGPRHEELNLLQITANGDNRDGLALLWAEHYLRQHAGDTHRLLIVLSDGVPVHEADKYYPPESVADTAHIVRQVERSGTQVVAIALDDEAIGTEPGDTDSSCYAQLQPIYPHLIECTDLDHLTSQLLRVIAGFYAH